MSTTRYTESQRIMEDIVDAVIDYLGSWNKDKYYIDLYCVPNDPKILASIRESIDAITTKYRWIVLDSNEEYTNIKIMDINL